MLVTALPNPGDRCIRLPIDHFELASAMASLELNSSDPL